MLLSEYKTQELVEELQKREGVKVHQTGVRASVRVRSDEPAIVQVVKSREGDSEHLREGGRQCRKVKYLSAT